MHQMFQMFMAAVLFALLLQNVPAGDQFRHRVVATVTDRNGQLVEDLDAADFIVREASTRRNIVTFSEGSPFPVSLGVLVDTSSSTTMPGTDGVSMLMRAKAFVRSLLLLMIKPGDEVQLMSSGPSFFIRQEFTTDMSAVSQALTSLRSSGPIDFETVLPQALHEVQDNAKNRGHRALIVVTDVRDSSVYGGALNDDSFPLVWEQIAPSELPAYLFAISVADSMPDSFRRIEPFPAHLAGRVHRLDIHSVNVLTEIVSSVAQLDRELRGQYTLEYYSGKEVGPGLSLVSVEVSNPSYRVDIDVVR